MRPLGHGVFDALALRLHGGSERAGGARAGREDGLAWTRTTSPTSSAAKPFLTTPGMAMWRERLFVLMARNAVRATAFFRLPPERVVELGVQVEL